MVRKKLAIGEEGFLEMIRQHRYYVDKTAYVKAIMQSGSYVHLITRPRRFGKTLFMGMLRTFLGLNLKNPGDITLQEELFDGLKIREDEAFCQACMGRFPVLSITLKNVKGNSFDDAVQSLADELRRTAETFAPLLESPKLSSEDRKCLQNIISREHIFDPKNRQTVRSFLTDMAMILGRHFHQPIVLLIDEYDVPLQKALKAGYYREMLAFMQVFLNCLKPGDTMRLEDDQHAIFKVVLTGCLRVSKASLFTDLNNFDVHSVCTQGGPLSSAIGFTAEEVGALLDYYGLESKSAVVKDWYDGYRIGNVDLYCPWDVIHYCRDVQADGVDQKTFLPVNYWADTSSNDAIDEFLGYLQPEDADKIQRLCGQSEDGAEDRTVEISVNHQLTYGDFQRHESSDFWTLLLFTGYLTVVSQLSESRFRVKIPNKEVLDTFRTRIEARYSKSSRSFQLSGREVVQAIFAGHAEGVKDQLLQVLSRYVSVRDSATRAPAENYYHGLMVGLLCSVDHRDIANFESNAAAGDGYADLLFTSLREDIGVVIELKHCGPREKVRMAKAGLEQIKAKRYADGVKDFGCTRCWCVGIAFSGRSCAVEMEAIQL